MSELLQIEIDETLTLIQLHEKNSEELYNLIDKNRNQLRAFLPWVDGTKEVKDTLEFIKRSDATVEAQKGITFTIQKNKSIIGLCMLHNWNHELKNAEIGYWVSEAQSRKGIITQCVNALSSYAFSYLNIQKLEIRFITRNEGSRRVAEKCGFNIEGIIRHAYLLNGIIEDLVITGKLKNE